MKTNGIVRKVDNLGRVVIPREYRKLHKISLGDPMEICCLDSGEILLKKMDMTLTLEELSFGTIRTLSEKFDGTVLVSNMEKWLGGSGKAKGFFLDRPLPQIIKSSLARREEYSVCDYTKLFELGLDSSGQTVMLVEPIAGDGDVFGGLYMTGTDSISETSRTILRVAAEILGNSLQKF